MTGWSLLSAATRDIFTADAKKIAAARGEAEPVDGRSLAFWAPNVLPRKVKEISVKSGDENSKIIIVTDDAGGHESVRMVFEEKQWRLDLTEQLRKPEAR